MSHLSPERLAALIDEQPTAAELAHLATCAACSRERGAFEALADMAKSGPAIGQPLTSWERLAPALKRDGVIDTGRGFGRRSQVSRMWMQAAAAVLLVVSGAVIGRATAAPETIVVPSGANQALAETRFKTIADAQREAERAQAAYQASMAWIAGHDSVAISASSPAAYKTRLAVLNQVSQIAGAALEDAPYDSVINTIYLNAQGQREASMRMLNAASRLMTY
jgi:hypothetical protein